MARVGEWVQLEGVRPFATGIEVQNSRSPGAEMAVLHTLILAGGDRFANFAAWAAMLGSLVGVSLLTRQLGGGRSAQLLAALITATLPTVLAQASSTMTDIVVALWVVIAASEVLGLHESPSGVTEALYAAAAAGLGLLTKPTAAAYLAPFGVLALVLLLRRCRLRKALATALAGAAILAGLNAGHLWRTHQIYGTLFDPGQVAVHANQERNVAGLISNVTRNLALNAGTPSPHVNKAVYLSVLAVHDWIGLDPSDPGTTSAGDFRVRAPSTHEDLASNPVHAGLYLAVVIWITLRWRRADRRLAVYLLTSASTLVVLSFIFKWQIFGGRYQVPLFVLVAPVAGVVLTERLRSGGWLAVAALLVASSWPWLTGIDSRPLIRRPSSFVGSILTESRQTLYFANAPYLQDALSSMGGWIGDARCSTVGIALSGNAPEYLVWVVMGAPRPDLRLEWIVGGTPSARYADPSFAPCAVICDESCPADWTTIRGLPLTYERAGYRLFMERKPP
jgi:4-amino-4-deoxy-L-arabinose transferase-like glycosyltransferase